MDAQAQSQGANEAAPVRRIVVPVEGTDREFLVQEQAVTLAAALNIPVVGIHVRSGTEAQRDDLFAWLDKNAGNWGVATENLVVDGQDVVPTLLEELQPLDLVVIGSQHMGERYHVGSLAEALIRQAPCPVQVVRLPA